MIDQPQQHRPDPLPAAYVAIGCIEDGSFDRYLIRIHEAVQARMHQPEWFRREGH